MADSFFGTQVNGFDKLIARLEAMPGVAKESAVLALLDIAENGIMPDAKENYVPFRLGALRDSGVVYREGDVVHLEFGSPDAIASAGGNPPQDYAIEQHETPDPPFSHDPATGHGGGSWKYLELPMVNWNDRILEVVAQAVRSSLEITSGFGTEIKIFSDFPKIEVTPRPPITKAPPRLVKKAKP